MPQFQHSTGHLIVIINGERQITSINVTRFLNSLLFCCSLCLEYVDWETLSIPISGNRFVTDIMCATWCQRDHKYFLLTITVLAFFGEKCFHSCSSETEINYNHWVLVKNCWASEVLKKGSSRERSTHQQVHCYAVSRSNLKHETC